MTSLFEQLGGTYRQSGDYLIPDLALPQSSSARLGKYGRMRRNFLKEKHPIAYMSKLMDGSLWAHLSEIDQTAHRRMEHICSAMAKSEGVTEALKASNQMEWVRRMNSIHRRAEEIVLTELVYTA